MSLLIVSSVNAVWNILIYANQWINERFGVSKIDAGNFMSACFFV